MATRTLEVLVDDLDGTAAVQTVPFGLDGVSYEIDLSQENADALRECLEQYVAAARRIGGRRKPPQIHEHPAAVLAEVPAPEVAKVSKVSKSRRKKSAGGTDRERLKNVRAWAAENGYEISERGRVSREILEAYDAAQEGAEDLRQSA